MLIPFKELFARHKVKTDGVLHLGANTGQEAAAYAQEGIKRVVWVEAIPAVYQALTRHISRFPGHTALQACVSDMDGVDLTFHVASNGGQSSSFLELGTHLKEHPSVRYVHDLRMRTVRVDTLLRNEGIGIGDGWFLNADLQGAELKAIRGMGDLLFKFDYAYIEINDQPLYVGCPLVREIDAYLDAFGLIGVETKMTGNHWGDKFYVRK